MNTYMFDNYFIKVQCKIDKKINIFIKKISSM